MLPTNAHKIIINSKGKLEGNSKNLQDLVKLMRGEKVVNGHKMIEFAQEEIKKINEDPKRKKIIVDYEMKMHEREQYGQQIGEEIGEKRGKKIGEKIGERKASLKHLKQYVKDLRDFGVPEDAILERAIESYSSDLSSEEIRAIVKEK